MRKRKKDRRNAPDEKSFRVAVPADAPLPSPLTPVTFFQWLLKNPQPPAPCILCGRLTRDLSLFFPFNQALVGAPRGKERSFPYRMCDECEKTDTALERAEKLILARIAEKARRN